jgi:anti-anti-sigma factor
MRPLHVRTATFGHPAGGAPGPDLRVRTSRAHPELLIDLRQGSFLSAAGLGVLAVLHVQCVVDGTSMHVLGDQPAVRRPMELTGLASLLADQ